MGMVIKKKSILVPYLISSASIIHVLIESCAFYQKKAAESLTLQPNSVRWVMGPAGKVVTFGENVGLPCIFNSKQCRLGANLLLKCLKNSYLLNSSFV